MNVVLFDGMCSFCDASVQFILQRDLAHAFRFGALQSPEAAPLLAEHHIDGNALSSMVLIDEEGVFFKSTAALRIAKRLNAPWNLAGVLLWVPRPMRDAIYDLIAKNRYRFFGRRDACRIPTPAERERFL